MSSLSSRYAVVTSTLALVVALGGVGYAAATLPRNSVGSAQLQKGAVTSSDVEDGALRAKDFRAGQLPTGPAGPQGPQGVPGTARAFGLVAAGGQVSNAEGMSTANVIRIGVGAYCVSGLSFTPQSPIATLSSPFGGGSFVEAGLGKGPSVCLVGTQVRIFTAAANGAAADGECFLLLT